MADWLLHALPWVLLYVALLYWAAFEELTIIRFDKRPSIKRRIATFIVLPLCFLGFNKAKPFAWFIDGMIVLWYCVILGQYEPSDDPEWDEHDVPGSV